MIEHPVPVRSGAGLHGGELAASPPHVPLPIREILVLERLIDFVPRATADVAKFGLRIGFAHAHAHQHRRPPVAGRSPTAVTGLDDKAAILVDPVVVVADVANDMVVVVVFVGGLLRLTIYKVLGPSRTAGRRRSRRRALHRVPSAS